MELITTAGAGTTAVELAASRREGLRLAKPSGLAHRGSSPRATATREEGELLSGARGPLSMPDNVTEIRGNLGHRPPPPPTASKRFVSAVPNPPTNLSAEAKAEWKRIMPELSRTKVVATGDRALLTTYCETWASTRYLAKTKHRMVEAFAQLTDPMEILMAGERIAKVEGAINAKLRLMLPMWQQLLLTPMARLRTPAPKDDGTETREDLD